jgi:uncharacterized protein
MRVNIDEIKEGGLHRSWDLPREVVDEIVKVDNAGYRASAPARVEGRLEKIERRVLFHGSTVAELSVPCGRCLAPTAVKVPVEFDLTYVPADDTGPEEDAGDDRGGGHQGGSFEPRAADEETYSSKTIDLDPAVREQVLLALPGYPVCQEACKGLCSVCGANLNERDCGCDRHVPDPRWAGLEKLKQKSKEE